MSPSSLHNVRHKWLPEVHRFHAGALVLLVGLQSDLRSHVTVLRDLAQRGLRPIAEKDARSAARSLGAAAYFECSALTQQNLKEVFDNVITLALGDTESQRQQRCRSSGGSKRWSRRSTSSNGGGGGGRASTSARPHSSLPKTPSSSDMSSKTLSSSGYSSDSAMLVSPISHPASTDKKASTKTAKTSSCWHRLCCLA